MCLWESAGKCFFPFHFIFSTRLLILFQDPVTEGWGLKPEAYLLLFNLIHYIPPPNLSPTPILSNEIAISPHDSA